MDPETVRRLKIDWVTSRQQGGAVWTGTDDELDRAFVLYAADGRPVLSERGWMSHQLILRNMCHGCQAQFVFVFVFVFVMGWHAYSPRVLSTGGSPRVHGWLPTGPG